MKKIYILLCIILLWCPYISFGQDVVTENPTVESTNCNICKIKKVVLSDTQTKILIEVTGQKKGRPWIEFSQWTLLLPYEASYMIGRLRDYDLEIPEPEILNDPEYSVIWRGVAEQRKGMQKEAAESFGEWFIKGLGNYSFNTKYNIKSKTGEKFNIWLYFTRLPKGTDKFIIIELTENGFEWVGIKINNPE